MVSKNGKHPDLNITFCPGILPSVSRPAVGGLNASHKPSYQGCLPKRGTEGLWKNFLLQNCIKFNQDLDFSSIRSLKLAQIIFQGSFFCGYKVNEPLVSYVGRNTSRRHQGGRFWERATISSSVVSEFLSPARDTMSVWEMATGLLCGEVLEVLWNRNWSHCRHHTSLLNINEL